MNIFLISRGFPEPKDRQWGNFELGQAEALRALGHKVTILVIDGRTRFYRRKLGITHNRSAGVYYYRLMPFSLISWIPGMVTGLHRHMLRKLFRYAVKNEGTPDVVYAHYLNNMFMALPLKDEFDGIVVGLEHWSELLQPNIKRSVDRVARKVYSSYDRVLAVSPELSHVIRHHYGTEAEYVPNIVADEFITHGVAKSKSALFRFCAVGRLVKLKNFNNLIQAVRILLNLGIKCELTIIGSGPEYSSLSQLITSLSLENHVVLAGECDRPELIEKVSESHVLVLPSERETFGVVLIEAMALGIPVIASNVGGPASIVNDSNGILINPGDVDELAAAMRRMIENYDNYDSRSIARTTASRYSSECVATQLTQIFEKTLQQKRSTQ